jgi:hypothetical protein
MFLAEAYYTLRKINRKHVKGDIILEDFFNNKKGKEKTKNKLNLEHHYFIVEAVLLNTTSVHMYSMYMQD